jgi:hypothetical protein
MRNKALSVLRARQLIINNAASMPCKQLIVLTWALVTSGEPHVRGCPRNSCTKGSDRRIGNLSILDRLV